MRHEAVLRLPLGDVRLAEAFYKALCPEAEEPPTGRIEVRVELQGSTLVIRLMASDTAALRAGLNSYLSWLKAMENACSSLKRSRPSIPRASQP